MKTRPLYAIAAVGGATLLALAAPRSTSGQNPPAPFSAEPSPSLAALVNDLTVQSRQLAENQALMDTKVDQISELVRQARIYAARGGKGGNLK